MTVPAGVRVRGALATLGPGVLMAACAIGTSHLVLSVQAGARYGFALLWVVLAANLLKYPAFECGPRFAMATGRSLLEGYARVPGPGRWALWVFLLGTVVQGVGVVGGVLAITAAIAAAAAPAPGVSGWSALLATAIVALLAWGRYRGLEAATKVMMVVLLAATVVAFVATPMPAGALRHLVVPMVPAGALGLIVALLGWMPAGIDVAVWHSLWSLEKQRLRLDGVAADEPVRGALLDMRLGYAFATVTGVMFMSLGATFLYPRGLVLGSAEVAPTLGRLYTESLGPWIYPVFLAAAFCTMFSTAFTCMDGFPRAFAECLRLLRGAPAGSGAAYWAFLGVVYGSALVLIATCPEPVTLVVTVATVSFMFAPIYAWLNDYCAAHLIGSRELRPGGASRALALTGVAVMAATAVVYLVQMTSGVWR